MFDSKTSTPRSQKPEGGEGAKSKENPFIALHCVKWKRHDRNGFTLQSNNNLMKILAGLITGITFLLSLNVTSAQYDELPSNGLDELIVKESGLPINFELSNHPRWESAIDLKTDCFPSSLNYFRPREKRNLRKSLRKRSFGLDTKEETKDENEEMLISPWEKTNDDDINNFNNKQMMLDHLAKHNQKEPFHQDDAMTVRRYQAKIMQLYMDKSTDPCTDFYQYACGSWTKLNPIPKDKGSYDTFEILRESLDNYMKELLEQPISDEEPNSYKKAKNLYRSCVNYDILEKRGLQPLLNLLDELGGWPVLNDEWDSKEFDWIWLTAQLKKFNNDILFAQWVAPDIKNSNEYIIHVDQTTLGLPTRDYFLHPANSIYLEAYKNYLINLGTLLGASYANVSKDAEDVIQFEVSLARITTSPDERRNLSELYQRMTVGELKGYIPQIDWQRYLSIVFNRPCNTSENVVVFAVRYIENLVNLLGQTEPRTVANYLLWRFIRHRVNNLDDRFQEAKQKFFFILFGREESPPRWKNCVTQVNMNMGMAVGAMFVRKYYDELSKNDTMTMTRDIQQAFREILSEITWIDKETKHLAKDKIDAITLRIGYPDSILKKDELDERYKDVEIDENFYFENTLSLLRHSVKLELAQLGLPVNKSMWDTTPATVNAFYSRNKNQIMFPAGILQPPFYHRYFPRSLNFGGIGVVIGHEMTHGFDDKGRLFDRHGNLKTWWKEEAVNNFHERAQCMIDQYGKFVVEEAGLQVDGTNTQGENIADNGGIKQAFRAYKKWVAANSEINETLPGMNFTAAQLFFLNFAQIWCGATRPAASRNKLKTAVHSPGKFRVIGTLSNNEDFAREFQCPLGSPMNPVKKCSVW